jgi:hypothetical protein
VNDRLLARCFAYALYQGMRLGMPSHSPSFRKDTALAVLQVLFLFHSEPLPAERSEVKLVLSEVEGAREESAFFD